MEENQFCREELLIGKEAIEKLKNAKVIVYGIGGVGSYTCEALARAGVGHFILVDQDIISISNLNRQIHATRNTIGKVKTEVMRERILSIYPEAKVEIYDGREIQEGEEKLMDNSISYVVDAVDTVTTKLKLVVKAKELGIPIISAMGTGNKLDPTKLIVTTIEKTSICPLAKVMRKELKNRKIKGLKVVYSTEEPIKQKEEAVKKYQKEGERRKVPGSISFVPSVAGLIIAGEVIKDIIAV